MLNYKQTASWVLALSFAAAFMSMFETFSRISMYSVVPGYSGKILFIIFTGILALIVPCCGWWGAQDRSASLLSWFACCSYFSGAIDLMILIWGVFIIISGIAIALSNASRDCAANSTSPKCDEAHRQKMLDVCESLSIGINASIVNFEITPERIQSIAAQTYELLSEQNCLDTMKSMGYGLMVLGVGVMMERCMDMGVHFASGYYGSKLRHMLLEETLLDETPGTSSDSDSD